MQHAPKSKVQQSIAGLADALSGKDPQAAAKKETARILLVQQVVTR